MIRIQKTILFLIITLLMVTIEGCSAFRQECEINKVWKIEDYEIIEKRCIGFAGPHFYPVCLYKNKKEIDCITYKSDSCVVSFKGKDGKALQFDLCSMKIIKSD